MEDTTKKYIFDYLEILKKNIKFEKESTEKASFEPCGEVLIPQEFSLIQKIEEIEAKCKEIHNIEHKPEIKIPENRGIVVDGKRYTKLYTDQNFKNGELYHIKEFCDDQETLKSFLDSNIFLYKSDILEDIEKGQPILYKKSMDKISDIVTEKITKADVITIEKIESKESIEAKEFFNKYYLKYTEMFDEFISKEFIDYEFKKKLFDRYTFLTKVMLKGRTEIMVNNYEMIKEKHSNRDKYVPTISLELQEKFKKIAQSLKEDLIDKANNICRSNFNFIEQNVVKMKLFYIFFDKLSTMADTFSDKSKVITDKYKEIINSNKAKIKSEILVQDKFLEYNDNIQNIIFNLDKSLQNAEDYISGESKTLKRYGRPWNKNYNFYKNLFIYSKENQEFNDLHLKYCFMDKNYLVEKYLNKISSIPINVVEHKDKTYIETLFEIKWYGINRQVYDMVIRRKLRTAILSDNYKEIYNIMIKYERSSGRTRHTENIKNYAIYNMINNDFINSKILEKF